MTTFKIHYRSDAVDAAIARLKAAAADMLPAWRDIGEYLVESTKRRFREGKAPDGSAWAPKSETTIAAYAARGDNVSRAPLIGPTRRLSSEITYGASRDGVAIGSSLVYSAVQQLGAAKGEFGKTARGAPVPWGNVPARPFLGLSRDDERNILDILTDHLSGPGAV